MSRIIDRQTYVKEITILTGEFHNYRDRFWQHWFQSDGVVPPQFRSDVEPKRDYFWQLLFSPICEYDRRPVMLHDSS